MLIISGRLFVKPGTRDRFLGCREPSLCMARRAPGCLDFSVSADIIEPDRANVYEAWTDAQSLEAADPMQLSSLDPVACPPPRPVADLKCR
jgi:quinol monooxygenase YgiN